MNQYYKIPNNYAYETFARGCLAIRSYYKYVKQFSIKQSIFLVFSNSPISNIPEHFHFDDFSSISLQCQTKRKKTSSPVCFSIRISELDSKLYPYEFIAFKIINFPYPAEMVKVYTDAYGIKQLIIY